MKNGEVITIYYDPVTQQQPEGQARLCQLLIDHGDRQYWQVSFVNEPTGRYERWIHPPLDGLRCGAQENE